MTSTPRERGILFSAPMVRALLAGTKTQTRRVVKPQPFPVGDDGGKHAHFAWRGGMYALRMYPSNSTVLKHCPYGRPGDRLWVRETWRPIATSHQTWTSVLYAADNALLDRPYFSAKLGRDRWVPSLHMPRVASRITLEITAVRVERLQEISDADAIAEGIEPGTSPGYWKLYGRDANGDMDRSPRIAYRSLFESINGPGSWDANPWVWVLEFRRA